MLFMSESTARRYLDWLREGNFGLVGLIVVIVGFKYVYAPIEAFVGALLLQRYF
jgi:hypothetical protein